MIRCTSNYGTDRRPRPCRIELRSFDSQQGHPILLCPACDRQTIKFMERPGA